MRKVQYFLLLFFCCMAAVQRSMGQANDPFTTGFNRLTNTHDILLSPWGPYSKKYAGVSHIADMRSGMRFDVCIVPGYGSGLFIPNVRMKSGYYPWQVNDDLTRYTYRYELQWKDQVYMDVSYHVLDSATTLMTMHCVNNTGLPQDITTDLMAYVDYPENHALQTILPSDNITWKNAVDYQSLTFAHPRPTDNLPNNGWLRAEVRDSRYIDGRAVANNFGRDSGDQVSYQLTPPSGQLKGNLWVRYLMKANTTGTFRLTGMINQIVTMSGTGDFEWKKIPYSEREAQPQILKLTSDGGSAILLNGIMLAPPEQQPTSYMAQQKSHWAPIKSGNTAKGSLILKYPDIQSYYGIAWDQNGSRVREIKNDVLDVFFPMAINDHVSKVFNGNGKGDYTDVCLGPVSLAAHEEKIIYAMLCSGTYEAVAKKLGQLNSLKATEVVDKRVRSGSGNILSSGEKYRTVWQLLKATLMTNIVYPIYTQNSFIRHFTPGKWWNSIYTWDLGFVALALNEINPDLAAECINAYTTPVGSQSAFVLHGSPVPTQMYAFYDLWNKTQSKQLLTYFYPRLKQYYAFLVGRNEGSTTRKFKSNLLSTWDYFYNSGGWDDYPPQVAVHNQHDEDKVAPVITTAQCIRVAKMLRMAAKQLHRQKDIKMYEMDIDIFSNALQQYAWDSTSGYFSYVVHNKEGFADGHFKYKDSVNFNMGLGGAYPLLSGICTPGQQKTLLDKIFSPKHMWTPAGITVVDQSAPYFKTDGYWNGKVWMPHQWFMWKTMLDLGRADLAFKIAQKALEVYKTEVDASYNTFEYFSTKTGRGAGWPQFSGLSSPVLNWFSAYYRIATVTAGFEIWIRSQAFNEDGSSYRADICFDDATAAHPRSMLVCMAPTHSYQVTFRGRPLKVDSPYNGLLEINLPATNKSGELIIKPIN